MGIGKVMTRFEDIARKYTVKDGMIRDQCSKARRSVNKRLLGERIIC